MKTTVGTLWIGTGKGLDRFNRKAETIIRYSPNQNIPNNVRAGSIEMLHGDSRHNLWIVTDGESICYDSSRVNFHTYEMPVLCVTPESHCFHKYFRGPEVGFYGLAPTKG